jgi:hypothetical protein
MRKTNQRTRRGVATESAFDTTGDTQPRRVSGSTITSGAALLDPEPALFARLDPGGSVTGSAMPIADAAVRGRFAPGATGDTVSLLDGTQISFVTVAQFKIVETI